MAQTTIRASRCSASISMLNYWAAICGTVIGILYRQHQVCCVLIFCPNGAFLLLVFFLACNSISCGIWPTNATMSANLRGIWWQRAYAGRFLPFICVLLWRGLPRRLGVAMLRHASRAAQCGAKIVWQCLGQSGYRDQNLTIKATTANMTADERRIFVPNSGKAAPPSAYKILSAYWQKLISSTRHLM